MIRFAKYVLLVFIFLMIGSYLYGKLSLANVQQLCVPEGKTLSIDGHTLHYLERNNPTGNVPVLFLHGASSNARDWQTTLFDQVSEDLHLVALDRPGLGHSNNSTSFGLKKQTEMIHNAAVHLKLDRPILVAHSLSGVIAARLLADYPEHYRGLVIVAGATYPIGDGRSWYTILATTPVVGALFRHAVVPALAPMVTPQLIEKSFSPQPVINQYAENACVDLLYSPERFLANASDLNEIRPFLDESYPRYSRIEQPVSMIYGDSDKLLAQFTHAWGFQYKVPHAKIVMLPDQGHMLHFSHPELIAKEIERMAQ